GGGGGGGGGRGGGGGGGWGRGGGPRAHETAPAIGVVRRFRPTVSSWDGCHQPRVRPRTSGALLPPRGQRSDRQVAVRARRPGRYGSCPLALAWTPHPPCRAGLGRGACRCTQRCWC